MIFASSILLLALAASDTPDAGLEVTVKGLGSDSGAVAVGLFDRQSGWESGEAVRGDRVAVEGRDVVIRFDGLPPGEYGLKVYHDVDGDGVMNRGAFGMPSEPYGFSNDARGQFGPASWSAAVFTIESGENAHAVTVR